MLYCTIAVAAGHSKTMKYYIKQLVTIYLLASAAIYTMADDVTSDADINQGNVDSPVGLATEAATPNQADNELEAKPKTSRIERAVMPFTQWVEEKIQNTSIIQPSIYHKKEDSEEEIPFTLRDAIKQAQQQFNGTVLSADRITDNDHVSYRIKILSNSGIVKLIDIDAPLTTEKQAE